MRPLLPLLCAAFLCVPSAADDKPSPSAAAQKALGDRLVARLQAAERIALYRLTPEQQHAGPNLGGYPIVKEARLDRSPADAVDVLKALFDERTYGGAPAQCFIPHHGIRCKAADGSATTLLVCFECCQIQWLEEQQTIFIESKGPLLDILELLLPPAGTPDAPPGAKTAPPAGSHPAFAPEILKLLAKPDRVTLYRIRPETADDGERIEGYPIIAKKALSPEAFADLRTVLLDPATYGGPFAMCFIPHHAVRIEKGGEAVNLVICFECNYMHVAPSGSGPPDVSFGNFMPLETALEAALSGGVDWSQALTLGLQEIKKGNYAAAREHYEQGLGLFENALAGLSETERAERLKTEAVAKALNIAHYNLACIYAGLAIGKDSPKGAAKPVAPAQATRHREDALAHLTKALELGWTDFKHLKTDADLAPLHDDPRWTELLQRYAK